MSKRHKSGVSCHRVVSKPLLLHRPLHRPLFCTILNVRFVKRIADEINKKIQIMSFMVESLNLNLFQ